MNRPLNYEEKERLREAAPELAKAIIETAKKRASKRLWDACEGGATNVDQINEDVRVNWPLDLLDHERAALAKSGLLTDETTK